MKKVMLLMFILILSFFSCKYEDGPKISLRSKNHRLINNWTIDKVYLSDIDKTDYYKQFYFDYRVDIRKDKSYTISLDYRASGRIYYERGSWAFSDDKMEAVLTPSMPTPLFDSLPRHWKIMRLNEKSFWIKGDINLDRIDEVVHFK